MGVWRCSREIVRVGGRSKSVRLEQYNLRELASTKASFSREQVCKISSAALLLAQTIYLCLLKCGEWPNVVVEWTYILNATNYEMPVKSLNTTHPAEPALRPVAVYDRRSDLVDRPPRPPLQDGGGLEVVGDSWPLPRGRRAAIIPTAGGATARPRGRGRVPKKGCKRAGPSLAALARGKTAGGGTIRGPCHSTGTHQSVLKR